MRRGGAAYGRTRDNQFKHGAAQRPAGFIFFLHLKAVAGQLVDKDRGRVQRILICILPALDLSINNAHDILLAGFYIAFGRFGFLQRIVAVGNIGEYRFTIIIGKNFFLVSYAAGSRQYFFQLQLSAFQGLIAFICLENGNACARINRNSKLLGFSQNVGPVRQHTRREQSRREK